MADYVFINCPFDSDYTEKFRAIVFTLIYCGFEPRCALEVADGSENRLEKITRIISQCRFGIHDISRTKLDPASRLPHFNMPFELGIFFGAKSFGGKAHASKMCLVLDTKPYRYQKFLSDISGQDIQAHKGSARELIAVVRHWLAQHRKNELLPGDQPIIKDFRAFVRDLPSICRDAGITARRVPYNDLLNIIKAWIAKKQIAA